MSPLYLVAGFLIGAGIVKVSPTESAWTLAIVAGILLAIGQHVSEKQ